MTKNKFKGSSIKGVRKRTGMEVKKKQTHADMGEGVQAKVDVHIWFKVSVFNCSITMRIVTPKSIKTYCN